MRTVPWALDELQQFSMVSLEIEIQINIHQRPNKVTRLKNFGIEIYVSGKQSFEDADKSP